VVSSVSTLFTPAWDDLYLTCSGCNAGSDVTVVPGQLALSKFFQQSCRSRAPSSRGFLPSDLGTPDKVLVNNDGTLGCFNANGSTQLAQPTAERVTVPQTAFAMPTQTSDGRGSMAMP
jgi:hypothetical protein